MIDANKDKITKMSSVMEGVDDKVNNAQGTFDNTINELNENMKTIKNEI